MTSLVLELQRDVLNKEIQTTDLLRKAYLVSRKLKIADIESWIQSELNGYQDTVPTYRKVHGELRLKNPYRGWLPVMVSDDFAEHLCSRALPDPIVQLQEAVSSSDSGMLLIKFPAEAAQLIMNMYGYQFEPALHFPTHQVSKIFEAVRNKIMEFSLTLEERGIYGDGMAFTQAEQVSAQAITNNTINIKYMSSSSIHQDTRSLPKSPEDFS